MKTSRIRNIILKALIIIISITLLGFQKIPAKVDPGPVINTGSYKYGWVEVILFGEAGAGSGGSGANFIWHQTQVTLPIIGFDSQGRSIFQGQAFTAAQGTANQGPATVQAWWPVHWYIKGTVASPPDCTIEMTIDETWYPGWTIGCAPFVGCMADVWPAAYHPGVPIKIPWEKAWGTAISGGSAMGMPVHLTAIIYHVVSHGGSTEPSGISPLGCEFHVMFPVIPQAEE